MESTQSTRDKITYNKTTIGSAKKSYDDLLMQPEWYDETEIILQDLAYGYIDSIECIHRLSLLGYSIGDIARDIMGDAEQARREAITKWDVYMEGELS